jgi:8-amino-7-oxononanoate synthase
MAMTASSNFWLQDIPQQLAALDAAALRRTRVP